MQGDGMGRREVAVVGAVDQQDRPADGADRLDRAGRQVEPWLAESHPDNPADELSQGAFQHPLQAAHRCALPHVPAGRRGHRDHGITRVGADRGVPQRHRGTHREPDHRHRVVALRAGPPDHGVQVEGFVPPGRGAPRGAAVPTEVDRADRAVLGEGRQHGNGCRFPGAVGEAVADHESRSAARFGGVGGAGTVAAGQSYSVGGLALEARPGHVGSTTVNVVTYPASACDFGPAASVAEGTALHGGHKNLIFPELKCQSCPAIGYPPRPCVSVPPTLATIDSGRR